MLKPSSLLRSSSWGNVLLLSARAAVLVNRHAATAEPQVALRATQARGLDQLSAATAGPRAVVLLDRVSATLQVQHLVLAHDRRGALERVGAGQPAWSQRLSYSK